MDLVYSYVSSEKRTIGSWCISVLVWYLPLVLHKLTLWSIPSIWGKLNPWTKNVPKVQLCKVLPFFIFLSFSQLFSLLLLLLLLSLSSSLLLLLPGYLMAKISRVGIFLFHAVPIHIAPLRSIDRPLNHGLVCNCVLGLYYYWCIKEPLMLNWEWACPN